MYDYCVGDVITGRADRVGVFYYGTLFDNNGNHINYI